MYIDINILAWTCPLNGQIEGGIDRCVGRDVFPDWLVELILVWAGSFILIGLWNRSLRGLTSSIPDRYVDQVPGSFQGRICDIGRRICDVEQVPGSFQGRICDVEQVPGSLWGRICDVEQVPGSLRGRICDVDQVPGSIRDRICDVEQVPGSLQVPGTWQGQGQ